MHYQLCDDVKVGRASLRTNGGVFNGKLVLHQLSSSLAVAPRTPYSKNAYEVAASSGASIKV
eukprot:6185009-Pleurochrysis_carterae.AAC.7